MKGFVADIFFDDGEAVRISVSEREATKNDGTFRNLIEARIEDQRRLGNTRKIRRPDTV